MSKNTTFKRIRNSAVIKNPLLFEAIGLCPVVAIAYSLKLAIFLAVVTAVELIVCEFLASKFLKNVNIHFPAPPILESEETSTIFNSIV